MIKEFKTKRNVSQDTFGSTEISHVTHFDRLLKGKVKEKNGYEFRSSEVSESKSAETKIWCFQEVGYKLEVELGLFTYLSISVRRQRPCWTQFIHLHQVVMM